MKRSVSMFWRSSVILAGAFAAAFVVCVTDAQAQTPKARPQAQPQAQAPKNSQASATGPGATIGTTTVQGPSNALQGFQVNRGKPIRIAANELEVRDKDKQATFSGDVHVIQGDTDLRCKVLVVYYEDNSPGSSGASAGGPGGSGTQARGGASPNAGAAASTGSPGGGQQQIRRMEAKGNVIVTQKDQTATGDNGDYDMRADTVTLTGNVVVTQGQNVLRGQKLVVNTTTGVSRMEMPTGGRVEGLFQASGAKPDGAGMLPRPGARAN